MLKDQQWRTPLTVGRKKTNNGDSWGLGETPDLEWEKFSSLHK